MSRSAVTGTLDVVGAEPALALFGTLAPERLAHGYLFVGPPGVGKKTFARALAQSLLCEHPKPTVLGVCNACPGCTLFAARTHPDFFETIGPIKIGERDARGADEITARDVVRALSLRPYRAAWRVLVLGDVSFAAPAAANALLKFFEEPPAGVLVVLTTDAADRLLDTIRSRMVEVPFPPLRPAEIVDVLRRGGAGETEALAAARAAQGSLAAAKAALDPEQRSTRSAIVDWFAQTFAGRRAELEALRLDDKTASGTEKRELLVRFVGDVRVLARDVIALQLGGETVSLSEDERERFRGLPSRNRAELEAMIAGLVEAQRIAVTHVSPALIVDSVRMSITPRGGEPVTR